LREPMWYKHGDLTKMCDIIIGHNDYVVPVEVKSTKAYQQKAIIQLNKGKQFVNEEFKLIVPYGKIVYYSNILYFVTEKFEE